MKQLKEDVQTANRELHSFAIHLPRSPTQFDRQDAWTALGTAQKSYEGLNIASLQKNEKHSAFLESELSNALKELDGLLIRAKHNKENGKTFPFSYVDTDVYHLLSR